MTQDSEPGSDKLKRSTERQQQAVGAGIQPDGQRHNVGNNPPEKGPAPRRGATPSPQTPEPPNKHNRR